MTLYYVLLLLVFSANAQYSQNNGLHSMLNNLVPNGSGDVQSLSYCRISTRDLITTAQATANRVLEGICNPRELNDRFRSLESQIVDQFNVLKTMVLNIEDKLRDQDEKLKFQHRKLHRAFSGSKGTRKDKELHRVPGRTSWIPDSFQPNDDFAEPRRDHLEAEVPSARDEEIAKLNSTIITKEGFQMFTYYWKVRDMPYRMKSWGWTRSLRSNSFHVFPYGYKMYMRVFPNQNGSNVYIHVGLTEGEYDKDLIWPFTLKHQVMILDHRPNGDDLSSRVWDPTNLCSASNWARPVNGDNDECVGLGFPQEILKSKKYLHGDSITIKLRVYLD